MTNEAEKPVSADVKNEAQEAETPAVAKPKLGKEEAISLRSAAHKVRLSADGLEQLTADLVDPQIIAELSEDEKAKKEKRDAQLRAAKATFNAKLAEKLARIDVLEAEKLASASKNNELATMLAALQAESALNQANVGKLQAELDAAKVVVMTTKPEPVVGMPTQVSLTRALAWLVAAVMLTTVVVLQMTG
jgi:hypothetical protein